MCTSGYWRFRRIWHAFYSGCQNSKVIIHKTTEILTKVYKCKTNIIYFEMYLKKRFTYLYLLYEVNEINLGMLYSIYK